MNAEPELYPPEALADDEPRYLRRQRPLDIRRRKFNRRSWPAYRRWMLTGAGLLAGSYLAYAGARFFLLSPRVRLANAGQIEVVGNQYVSRETITEHFSNDFGKSVMRVPLDERRAALESIPWVAQASVERSLPNRIRVELAERVPVAFLRTANELALVDGAGVILERPIEGDFHFPVVSGMDESMPLAERGKRMQLFVQFLKEIDLARPGASESVSEADLSDVQDVRATLSGLQGADPATPVVAHFGDGDFINKYRLLLDNLATWQASAGRVESVDLRFSRQVVVNPERETPVRTAKR